MKALLAAAALAALPITAQAVTIASPVSYDGGASPTSITFDFAVALDDVEFGISTPFPVTLTFEIPGYVPVTSFGPGYLEYSLGDFSVGDSFTLILSGDTSYSYYITGTTPVPVPAAGLLAGAGVVALGALRARRKKA